MKIFTTLLLFLNAATLQAQVDQPTTAEKQVLDHAIPIILRILDQFNSSDWEIEQDFYSGDVLVNQKPDVPMDIDQNFERQYRVKFESDRYNSMIKPVQDKIKNAMDQGNITGAQKLGKEIKAVNSFTVDVYINRKVANVNPGSHDTEKLSVPGVDLCYVTKKDQQNSDYITYQLLFGNWKTAKYGEYGLSYSFDHPHKSPYIENIEIIIKGADDYIQKMLKSVDWSQMQGALTK